MNKSKQLSLINMIVNLAVIVLGVLGFYFLVTNQFMIGDDPITPVGPDMLKYYTVLTALVTLIAAALMIWANIISYIKGKDSTPRLFYTLRFISAVMSLLTLVTVVAFIYPELKANESADVSASAINIIFGLEGGSLFLHFLCPVLSILQFIGLEIEPKAKFKKTLEPFIGTILYGLGIIIATFSIQATQGVMAAGEFIPYYFFAITPELAGACPKVADPNAYGMNIGILVAVIAIAYVAAILLWALNRMCHSIVIGEEYVPAGAKKATPKKATTSTAKKGNAFTSYVKKKVAFGDGSSASSGQVYHISYHDRKLKTWKVKTENAGRALKVFPTQKEAIDFANQCVRKNGGSIRVHSMMGKIRKE